MRAKWLIGRTQIVAATLPDWIDQERKVHLQISKEQFQYSQMQYLLQHTTMVTLAYFQLDQHQKNEMVNSQLTSSCLSFISFKERNHRFAEGVRVGKQLFCKLSLCRILHLQIMSFYTIERCLLLCNKVTTNLTSGNSEGPSKLLSMYLIKSRLSPLTSLLCSSDGTCIQIAFHQNHSWLAYELKLIHRFEAPTCL